VDVEDAARPATSIRIVLSLHFCHAEKTQSDAAERASPHVQIFFLCRVEGQRFLGRASLETTPLGDRRCGCLPLHDCTLDAPDTVLCRISFVIWRQSRGFASPLLRACFPESTLGEPTMLPAVVGLFVHQARAEMQREVKLLETYQAGQSPRQALG